MPKNARKQDVIFWKRVLFTSVPLIVLFAAFARWALADAPNNTLAILSAAALAFLFALLGIRFIPQWMAAWSRRPWLPERLPEGKRSARWSRMHPMARLIVLLALFRVSIYVVAYLMLLAREGYSGGVFDSLELWNRVGTDSRHYLSIAENGYASTGDDRLLIVFFPLYPLLVRLVNYVFNNYLTSGLFLSGICWVFAAYMLYELALLDTNRKGALRALKYLCILPASFLFSAPLSDSLFLLLSLLCVYWVRRDRYPLAGVAGFFAAFTRMPGILLFVPACFELVGRIIREHRDHGDERSWGIRRVVDVCSLFLIPLGLVLYIYINYRVTGNALMFLTYQHEHWHQQLGWFFATAATLVQNATGGFAENARMVWGLWIPNIVYLFSAIGIVIAGQNKLRASNVAYFIAYFVACMGATWLLSAPRYLTAAYPLSLALGAITEKKWVDRLSTIVCITLFLLYLLAFVNQWYVY